MNEDPEETVNSTNPKFPGYALRQNEAEWLVYRNDGKQVGLITTSLPRIFDVAPVSRGPRPSLREVEGFQQALAYCLENFGPSPIGG